MKFTAKQYAEALYDSLSETRPSDEEKILENFVHALAAEGALGMFAEIETEFLKLESKKKGEIPVSVTFATSSNQAQRQVVDDLHRVIGKNVTIKKNIDAGILGGVVIETEDERIDASVKKQLKNLKNSFTQ